MPDSDTTPRQHKPTQLPTELNRHEISVLIALLYVESARFSELMKPTGLQSDNFKFCLRKLQKYGCVEKTADARYRLTKNGKVFAHTIDKAKGRVQRQPKVSVLLVVSRVHEGQTQYLIQNRLQQPFWGYWCFPSGRVLWGESFQDSAARTLRKLTGLAAEFTVVNFYRRQDFIEDDRTEAVADYVFALMTAQNVQGTLTNATSAGNFAWLSLDELLDKELHFEDAPEIIKFIESQKPYTSGQFTHQADAY